MKNESCCKQMSDIINYVCSEHGAKGCCADKLVCYDETFNEYGIIIHDGGMSYILINFCPWCGSKLPKSERDTWFSELKNLGYDSPFEQEIPEQFKSNRWRLN
jgi:hypothetical protein